MASIQFYEMCVPPRSCHHRKRIVRKGRFVKLVDEQSLVDAGNFWDELFLRHRPEAPMTGPLWLKVMLVWPWNSTDSKKARATGVTPHDRAPDLDNLMKTITDSLGRCGYFINDSQIADLNASKWRGNSPGVHVMLWDGGSIDVGETSRWRLEARAHADP